MLRRLLVLVSLVLAQFTAGAWTPDAAMAATCTSSGTMELSTGVGAAVLFPPWTVGFEAWINCVEGGTIDRSGTMSATCTEATGDATMNGGVIRFRGDPNAYQVTPVVGSCFSGTATQFQLTGTAAIGLAVDTPCAGAGSMEVSNGLGATGIFPPTGVFFDALINCLGGGTFHYGGTMTATCTEATGDATMTAGVIRFNGNPNAYQVTPTRGSCTNGTATQFQLTGTTA